MFVLGGDSLDYWLTRWVLGEDHLWFVLLVLGFNFVGCSWMILCLVDEKMKKGGRGEEDFEGWVGRNCRWEPSSERALTLGFP